MHSTNISNPRVITIEKYAAKITTIKKEIRSERLQKQTKQRSYKYMNNIIEQDHRGIERITDNMLGFKHYKSACSTIQGIEAMNMIRKKQANTKTVSDEIKLINQIYEVS